ncbi:jg18394 [Pararge aegeria aegeria]|uniref:Jg18394 protein n=1 Tax=Pararge aegeria aegeria TaxID=348720 RepID=A0A8S4QKC1_9NEOP|nr:jg18394 [Pararge aegeria aegeria]
MLLVYSVSDMVVSVAVEDASGRYTAMFYWGNNYWTGSAELCSVLNELHAPSRHHNRKFPNIIALRSTRIRFQYHHINPLPAHNRARVSSQNKKRLRP